jgi:restriction endonuclease
MCFFPDKFKIEMSIGTYNPDWAVYIDKNGQQLLYFVLETKRHNAHRRPENAGSAENPLR